MMPPKAQRALARRIQSRWRTDARKDRNYNQARADYHHAQGNTILERFFRREVGWDNTFYKKRSALVKKYSK